MTILLSAALLLVAPAQPAERVERHLEAMGTVLAIVVEAPDRTSALAASQLAADAVRAAETRLSTWTVDSELSRVNAGSPGHEQRVSPLLARDLAAAKDCSLDTAGAFTPGLGALVRAWGLRSDGRTPDADDLRRLLPALDAAHLILDGDAVSRTDSRFVLEEGAFGKGIGLDDAADALDRSSARGAVLDLGGQVRVWGTMPTAIAIADPDRRHRPVLELLVSSGSVSTTGNSERGIVVDGEHLGHVLDPATGYPVEDFGSLTVWAATGVRADCLSTGLYVMGPDRALDWAARHPDVAVVVVTRDATGLVARASANLEHRIRVLSDDVSLRIERRSLAPAPRHEPGSGGSGPFTPASAGRRQ